MTTYWNAELYERIGTPMRQWASALIADLALQGSETVLDAGCGSGSVTMQLAARVPEGRVYAVDSSEEMIRSLSGRLQKDNVSNVVPVHADLTTFSLPEPVDCVFSNAVFHWISDDQALFGNLFRATRPGGRLRAQCGGAGNLSRIYRAVDEVRSSPPFLKLLAGFTDAKKYRTPEEATVGLSRAGWSRISAWCFSEPVPFEDDRAAVEYMRTITLRDHVAALPSSVAEDYLAAVLARSVELFGRPFVADYVRLNLSAFHL